MGDLGWIGENSVGAERIHEQYLVDQADANETPKTYYRLNDKKVGLIDSIHLATAGILVYAFDSAVRLMLPV